MSNQQWQDLGEEGLRTLIGELMEVYDLDDDDVDALIPKPKKGKRTKRSNNSKKKKEREEGFFDALLKYTEDNELSCSSEETGEEEDWTEDEVDTSKEESSASEVDSSEDDVSSSSSESESEEEVPLKRGRKPRRTRKPAVSFEEEKKPKFKKFTIPQRRPKKLNIRKNKYGRFEEAKSGLLLDRETKEVYGVQSLDGRIVAPTKKHLKMCEFLNVRYNKRMFKKLSD